MEDRKLSEEQGAEEILDEDKAKEVIDQSANNNMDNEAIAVMGNENNEMELLHFLLGVPSNFHLLQEKILQQVVQWPLESLLINF